MTLLSYVRGTDVPIIEKAIGQVRADIAMRFPDREALISRQQNVRLSWREFDQEIERTARGLEALRIGLVDWVVPRERLDETTETIIAGTLKGSATARGVSKKLVTASFDSGFEEAFSTYLGCQERALLSDDHKHAMAAYRGRKK
jgi:hypothetical protein